jgi:hypothetical protein
MSKWLAIPAAIVLVLAGARFARYLTVDRGLVASTPSPRPLFKVTDVPLASGQRLCLTDVTIPRDAQRLRVQVTTFGRPGPALAIELRAGGYAQRLQVPAGYPDATVLDAPMRPPRNAGLGEVCLRHDGGAPIALVGTTEERTLSRPVGKVDGRTIAPDTYLVFDEAGTASALAKTPAIIDRMSAFRPGVVGPWLLWPLLAIVIVGVPGGVVWALRRALGS